MGKKHILSYFSSVKKDFVGAILGPTSLTESVETSDVDEFSYSATTELTHSIENSDPDECCIEPSIRTFSVETSDEDEFIFI